MTSRPPITPRARPALDGASRSRVVGHYSQDGHTIVWAQGEIDIVTAPALMQELTVAVRVQPCRVVVDLTDVTFMDSTGINALVVARRRADIGSGELRLVAPCRLVRKVLRITGLDQILPVDSTIEESIGSMPVERGRDNVVRIPLADLVPVELDQVAGGLPVQDPASSGPGLHLADEG